MVSLLNLPFELREPILLDVILDTTQDPSEDHSSAEHSTEHGLTHECTFTIAPSNRVFHRPLQRHAMALLHVNQQIREEVMNLVPRRLGQKINDAKLDVLYVREPRFHRDLYGTWLSAPFPTKHFNTVHARIRLFQITIAPGVRVRSHRDAPVERDCEDWIGRECADMLLTFLAESLVGQEGNTRTKHQLGILTANRTIQDLVIDIPFIPDSQASPQARIRCAWCPDAAGEIPENPIHHMIPSGKRAALVFAQTLHDQLMPSFNSTPIGWCNSPRNILERIGKIHLNVDGRLFKSLDLGKVLAKLPCSEKWTQSIGGPTRAEFFEWKRGAEKKRKDSGFEVIRPSFQEQELVGSAGLIASMLSKRCETLVRDVATSSEDIVAAALQPERGERVAFTGKAMFFPKDGNPLDGNATFYTDLRRTWPVDYFDIQPVVDESEPYYPDQDIEELPKDGEVALFKGEAILFHGKLETSTVTSGDATFYGRAEDASTGQPGSIEVVSSGKISPCHS